MEIICVYYSCANRQEEKVSMTKISESKETVSEKLHRIRVKLYPNYLPGVEGSYIAKTDSEASLSIEEICASLIKRGGFPGEYNVLVDCVKKYFDEAAYKLCDGFAVSYGHFSIHPNIGGTFSSVRDVHDIRKNPINFKFRINSALRKLAEDIDVIITGLEDGSAYIDEFVDNYANSVNTMYAPGDVFSIYGNKIKVAGDNPDCGIFFVPVDAPSKAVRVKRIVENFPSKIIGEVPKTKYQRNRIEIRTQFSGSGNAFLKQLRVITSGFILESA